MRRWLIGALLGVCAAVLVTPAVSSALITGHTRLRITPAAPHPHTNVVVLFRQPTFGGLLPALTTQEELVVTGPARRGCITGVMRQVTTVEAGTPLRETLRPAKLATGRWCEASYRVALEVTQQQTCPVIRVRHVCPQFVPAPTVVASARFRVTRAPAA